MCPDQFPGLQEVYGQEFKTLYERYEQEIRDGKHSGKNFEIIKAQTLWEKICELLMESGVSYILFKDHANRKNNQSNLGTLKTSNLCAEILEFVSPDEIAVCTLASLCLPRYIKSSPDLSADPMKPGNYSFDLEELHRVTKIVVNHATISLTLWIIL